jgi:signal transduction histidine kinase
MPLNDIPPFIANRKWWILPLLVWLLAVSASFVNHRNEIDKQSIQIAASGARNMFRMIVLTRAWNAQHGGVYVPVTETLKPNPALDHPRRDITTTDGQQLTMVNPAFMTRLLSELAETQNVSAFHITSLKPIRPGNKPDDWERIALQEFDKGAKEKVELITPQDIRLAKLRYMAPLPVIQACMPCHEKQGYKVGDIRGGISVTLPLREVYEAAAPAKSDTLYTHLTVLILISFCGWLLLNLLRHRWIALGESNAALEHAKQAAESANIAKNAFLSNMSHELRTPLNAIVGHTHLLKRHCPHPEQQNHIGRIQHASSELLDIFDMMFDMTKAESGDLELAHATFDVTAFVDETYRKLQSEAAARQLSALLLQHQEATPCWVLGDKQRIGQVLAQFIDNAIKFSPHGEITLETHKTLTDDGRIALRFAVSDQGIGIDEAHLGQLFTLFHQLDSSLTRRHGGNGIGLYMCRQLATLMGGEVGATSKLNAGSTFWLTLTLDKATPGEIEASLAPQQKAANEAVSNIQSEIMPSPELLTRLRLLLEEDDFSIVTWWRQHAAQLNATLGDAAPRIEAAVNNYDFGNALIALKNWEETTQ